MMVCYMAKYVAENSSNNAWNVNYNGNANNNNGVVPVQEHVTSRDIVRAYRNCIRNKKTISGNFTFGSSLLRNLAKLKHDLNSGSCKPSRSYMFVVTWPKPREVWVSCFRDRVVNHLIALRIIPILEPKLHPGNAACVKGRGTLFAINKVISDFRKCSGNYAKPVYFLKLDIAGCFTSINRAILADLCMKLDIDDFVKRLIVDIVNVDCTDGAVYLTPWLHDLIPKHKSLRYTDKALGLPIGNLMSQILSGYIYLHQLDLFIKQNGIKYYTRYVDDIVIISDDRKNLERAPEMIASFLQSKLRLDIAKEKTSISCNIVKFCGRIIKPWRTYCIRRYYQSIINAPSVQSLISYKGLLKHSNSYNAWCYCIARRQLKNSSFSIA